jgi:hypothetical protein
MRNVSNKSCIENENTNFIFSNIFPKHLSCMNNVEKCGEARYVADDNTAVRDMLDN